MRRAQCGHDLCRARFLAGPQRPTPCVKSIESGLLARLLLLYQAKPVGQLASEAMERLLD